MSWEQMTEGTWLLRSASGATFLFVLVWLGMRLTRQPARRQRIGEWGLCASLLLALLVLTPPWLLLPVSLPTVASDPDPGASSTIGQPSQQYVPATKTHAQIPTAAGPTELAYLTPEPNPSLTDPLPGIFDSTTSWTETPPTNAL